MSATRMWPPTDAAFPANGSPRQRLGFAMKYAYLAAAPGDWQPWEMMLEDAHLNLCVRPRPDLDPDEAGHREGMIQCGVALQYLKVALRRFGCLGRVELFPDLDRRSLVARVAPGNGGERGPRERALFEAMTPTRDAGGFSRGVPLGQTTLADLSQAVATDRGWLEFTQSDFSRQRLLEYTMAGEPSRPLSAPESVLGVVKTKTDDEHGWLSAGQTLALAALQAQAWGVSCKCFHSLPRRESREALRRGVGHKGFGQAILHLGPGVSGEAVQLTPPATATATAALR